MPIPGGKQASFANPEGKQHYRGKRTVSFCLSIQQKGKRQQEQGQKHHPLLNMSGKGGGGYLYL